MSLLEELRGLDSLAAVTLWQPWAWAVAHAGKDVENRGWPAPPKAVGKPLAIHAGLQYDAEAAEGLRRTFGLEVPGRNTVARGAVVAVGRLTAVGRDSPSRWAIPRAYHWALAEILPLPEPVLCKGAQGLWQLSGGLLARVREQFPAAGAAQAEAGKTAVPHLRASHRAWSAGSSRSQGPAQRTGVVYVERLQAQACEDCGRFILRSGPGPHRHGGHLMGGPTGRTDCLGRPATAPSEEERHG